MHDELKDEHNTVLVKSKQKFNPLLRLINKFPHINKRLIILILIILAIPITVGLALLQQELRSRASGGQRSPIVMGISLTEGTIGMENRIDPTIAAIENFKNQSSQYPGSFSIWVNFSDSVTPGSKFPDKRFLDYLDSKEITPVVFAQPVGGGLERKEGRFIFSSATDLPTGAFPVGQLKFDSSNVSEITKIYVSKTASGTEFAGTLANTWISGAKVSVFGTKYTTDSNGNEVQSIDYTNPNHFDFTINSKADKGSYWELGVIVNRPGTLGGIFTNSKPIFISMADTFAKNYSNQAIANGSLDSTFEEWARGAKEYGKPVVLRYAHEMEGNWFPWSNGQPASKTSFGRYRYFNLGNTSQNYIEAWKHMHDVISRIAPNVKFFWCPTTGAASSFYPGSSYVDFVGFDQYEKKAPQQPMEDLYRNDIRNLRNYASGKPVIVGETGILNGFPNRSNWIKDGYPAVYSEFPEIKDIIYFNIDLTRAEGVNWSLTASPKMMTAYAALSSDPRFQGHLFKNTSPSPTPPPAAELPFGNHDSASCTNITGWACDENNYSNPVSVELYDGPKSEGVSLGRVTADKPRESTVAAECGGIANHGFSFSTPTSIKDGTTHRIYAYAVDDRDPTAVSRLSSSPKVVSCAGGPPTPTPTPPDPAGCVRKLPVVSYKDTSKSGKRKGTAIYRITIKNNDINCSGRKVALDLNIPVNLPRWTYLPESVKVAPNETKVVDFKVTSGPYSSFGVKNLNLTISGVYRPHTIFSVQTLQYKVTE